MPRFPPLPRSFYARPAEVVARDCLGKMLVWEDERGLLGGRIVEVEAYIGVRDQAAHCFGGRRTKRNEIMYGPAGHAYVFLIYGLHTHLNFVTDQPGQPSAVLLRAVEPAWGEDLMRERRSVDHRQRPRQPPRQLLTSGPGRLCQAFAIDLACNGLDLCKPPLYLTLGPAPRRIAHRQRIGIDYAGSWAKRRLRFIDPDSLFISRP